MQRELVNVNTATAFVGFSIPKESLECQSPFTPTHLFYCEGVGRESKTCISIEWTRSHYAQSKPSVCV